ncbi:hypothetical protein GCM10022384_37350 [Streptomyces marokkonensis]|uniref:Uncharacterized protein n=1 Tax=Streptomyces marokkonensis TaxID=324855 RepID=A0ABP7QNJ2_9ACTN
MERRTLRQVLGARSGSPIRPPGACRREQNAVPHETTHETCEADPPYEGRAACLHTEVVREPLPQVVLVGTRTRPESVRAPTTWTGGAWPVPVRHRHCGARVEE